MAGIAASQATAARQQGLAERQLGIAEKSAAREGNVQDINLQIAQMSLDKQKQIQGLADTLLDDTAPDEARQSALDDYRLLTGQEGKVIQVGGGQEWDENANAMRNLPTRLFDATTRQFIDYDATAEGQYVKGKIYRDKDGNRAKYLGDGKWEEQ